MLFMFQFQINVKKLAFYLSGQLLPHQLNQVGSKIIKNCMADATLVFLHSADTRIITILERTIGIVPTRRTPDQP